MDRQKQIDAFVRILDIVDKLRVECPWDRKQTLESLRCNTIEETYELAESIISRDFVNIKKELGDVLLHILFYSKIADEGGEFDIADVCDALSDKLIFRHPHIYPPKEELVCPNGTGVDITSDEVKENWEAIKLKEKGGNKTVLGGVPQSLPALIKAQRIQSKVRSVGFDWDEREQVWEKVQEEIGEFQQEVNNMDEEKMEGEFGDVMFSLVNAARLYGINPENALEKTNQKFIKRFNYLESRTMQEARSLKDMTLAEMDEIWEDAKKYS